MGFDEYQKKALSFDVFNEGERSITSLAFITKVLGLVGETGELADKFKKIYRDDDGVMSDEKKDLIIKELGDVLWYIAIISEYMGCSLQDVADGNVAKLQSRMDRNKIGGSGDNR